MPCTTQDGADKWLIAVPAGVIAQAWRGGPRQARVARLVGDPVVETVVLDDLTRGLSAWWPGSAPTQTS